MLIHIADILGLLLNEKAPAAFNSRNSVNNINLAIPPSFNTTEKQLETLKARFAIAGHVLVESNQAHGPASYHATRWGMVNHLADLDAAEAFLRQIGGVQ